MGAGSGSGTGDGTGSGIGSGTSGCGGCGSGSDAIFLRSNVGIGMHASCLTGPHAPTSHSRAGADGRYPHTVTSAPRFRFAPSPTGYLHVGNARAALFNWLEARRVGGEMLLRVEDTDRERSSSELVENILASLRWLGLDWDGEIVFQADNLDVHREAALSLLAQGQAYWCDCTSEQVQARAKERGGPPGYDGFCRDRGLPQSDATALRFRAPDEGTTSFTDLIRGEVSFENKAIEDFVLLRSTGMPMFLLSNAFDDASMGITHVVRGEDHVPGTPKYLLLRDALGLGRPEVFAHLPMLVNEGRQKLSKRKDAVSVADFAAAGYLPEALVNYLALIGWSPGENVELLPIDELARRFNVEDVGHSAGVFDPEKLAWMNRHYMKAASLSRLASECARYFVRSGFIHQRTPEAMEYLASLLSMAVGSVDRLEEVPDRVHFVFAYDANAALDRPEIAGVLHEAGARQVIDALASEITGLLLDRESFRTTANRVKERTGQKGKALFHPIRAALTGEAGGPELDLAVPAIDRGAALPPQARVARIVSTRERAQAFARAVADRSQ
jgi:glutamyl-tRNA synthetase